MAGWLFTKIVSTNFGAKMMTEETYFLKEICNFEFSFEFENTKVTEINEFKQS